MLVALFSFDQAHSASVLPTMEGGPIDTFEQFSTYEVCYFKA